MALKQMMLARKISEKRERRQSVVKKEEEYAIREAEFETALEEAKTEEEIGIVEAEIEIFEQEKEDNEKDKKKLEEEIAGLERELEESRKKEPKRELPNEPKERGGKKEMIKRGVLSVMTAQERDAFILDEGIQDFLERTRSLKGQTRAVSGAELFIPEIMLELIRDNIDKFSKLIGHIRLKPVSGTARQNISGTIPEAVWTEAIATLNELEISFNQVEVDGYKVGGFIPIPNATLEDSDLDMAAEIVETLGQAIGYAIDKAVLYGKGIKMPLGIVTRLAQATKPSDYPTKAPEWKDISTLNIKKLNIMGKTGTEFFVALILGLGGAKENYSDGKKFWCMNSTTKTEIMAKAVTFNAAGALVAATSDEMPIIGGKIETLPFMAVGEIVGGYGSLYLLAERKGGTFAVSDQVRFIEDMTVFKGTARYDGKPVIPDGFVAVTLGNTAVTTAMDFTPDKANTATDKE